MDNRRNECIGKWHAKLGAQPNEFDGSFLKVMAGYQLGGSCNIGCCQRYEGKGVSIHAFTVLTFTGYPRKKKTSPSLSAFFFLGYPL